MSGGEFLVVNPGDQTEEGAVVLPKLRDDSSGGAEGAAGGQKGGQQKAGQQKGGASGAGGGGKGKDASGKGQGQGDSARATARSRPSSVPRTIEKARQAVQQHCVEEQFQPGPRRFWIEPRLPRRPPPVVSIPDFGPASAPGPGGPSDQVPQGTGSPSMQAPTQGAKKGGAHH